MNKTTCSCSLCAVSSYEPADYYVDLSKLKKVRPIGVSGLMRVKNEASWVAQSIDSCIDALDELIICYQDCSDRTPEIIEEKRCQYPDKIKVFFYAPVVYAHDLSKDEFDYACSLPEDSIHLLSNYNNYTLSKASFRYAMKIDADQIYFKERLLRLCDAYRSSFVEKKSLSAYLVFGYYRLFMILGRRFPTIFFRLLDLLPFKGWIMDTYWRHVYAQVAVSKQPVSLSGINLYGGRNGWGIPAFSDGDGALLAFNGAGDHLVFEIVDGCYYYPTYQTVDSREETKKITLNSVYPSRRTAECFHLEGGPVLYAGFFWYHMKFVGRSEIVSHPLCEKIKLNSFWKMSLSQLFQKKRLNIKKNLYFPHLFFFMHDKELPSPEPLIKE